jgi:hypothetical protein
MVKYRPGDLPPDVRAELERATRIPDRVKRLDAIDRARERAERNYPELFKKETHMEIKLKNVRLAFPNLFRPTAGPQGGEPAYNAAFILPKDHPQIGEIRAAMQAVAKAKWGEKAKATYELMLKKDHVALHDGDNKPDLTGYPDNYYINARNKTRPLVVDRNRAPLDGTTGRPYSGCYVNVILELWAQDNDFGKKINASLGGVQFYADGDSFSGGRPASVDAFDDISDIGGGEETAGGEDW